MAEKTDVNLAERLRMARKAANVLAHESDLLNDSLKQAQEALAELNLGVTAWVEMGVEDDGSELSLGFGKLKSGWALFVERAPTGGEPELMPLLAATREVRLLAADKLPELVLALVSITEAKVKEVIDRNSRVDDLVKQLREAQS